jgi:hypothetical protein
VHEEVDEHGGSRANRRPQALDQDRPDLHVRAAVGSERVEPFAVAPHFDAKTQEPRKLRNRPAFNNNYAGLSLARTASGIPQRRLRTSDGSTRDEDRQGRRGDSRLRTWRNLAPPGSTPDGWLCGWTTRR